MNQNDSRKLVRADMSSGPRITVEEFPRGYRDLGGRGLIAAMLLDEMDPRVGPMSGRNKLILASGLLGQSGVPCAGRLSVGGKSPLTGTIKESNVGGTAGQALSRLGIGAVVIEGIPPVPGPYVLFLSPDGGEIREAAGLSGLGTYDTAAKLRSEYGKDASIVCTGPAGELLLPTASVAVTNMEGLPSRHAGRGGLGAVMGSKGVKAVVISGRSEPPTVGDRSGFTSAVREFVAALNSHPTTSVTLRKWGTASLVNFVNSLGAMPTRNFSAGAFEKATEIDGIRLATNTETRGGKTGHACYPGCVIKCSNIYPDERGEYITSGLEYETIVMLGSNCGLGDLDVVAKLDRMCDDLGLDTMETGAAIAVAMEGGLLEFGDGAAMLEMVRLAGRGQGWGRVIGQGTAVTGKMLGVKRVPVVKDQSLAAYDPRVLKGVGVTYSTSTMGADHTMGNGLGGPGDATSSEGKIEYARKFQKLAALLDTLGLCWFTRAVLLDDLSLLARIIACGPGIECDPSYLDGLARSVLRDEHEFNDLAGFTAEDDRLPAFFYEEPLPPTGMVFDIPPSRLDQFTSEMSAPAGRRRRGVVA
ncbi:MAG: aldehyde ferredoxin oxidoreductase [Firmicutes bacterium]|nr:aldehyde ferredoxin oxidoreductase [Bacillota bacterium]